MIAEHVCPACFAGVVPAWRFTFDVPALATSLDGQPVRILRQTFGDLVPALSSGVEVLENVAEPRLLIRDVTDIRCALRNDGHAWT